jgi:hypothetical protein
VDTIKYGRDRAGKKQKNAPADENARQSCCNCIHFKDLKIAVAGTAPRTFHGGDLTRMPGSKR